MNRAFRSLMAALTFCGVISLDAGSVSAQVRVASVKKTLPPLSDFRRIELLTSRDFTSTCQQRGSEVICKLSKVPTRFAELMIGLRGGNIASVELRNGKRGAAELRFTLLQKGLQLRDAVLQHPPRWVIEIGPPEVLLGPVVEQQPFRPYPVPPTNISARIPESNLQKLNPENPDNLVVNQCFDLWKAQRSLEAIETCTEVVNLVPDKPAGVLAQKIIAEARMGFLDPSSTDKFPEIVKALQTAEKLAEEPLAKARYTLLLAQAFEAVGYLNRSEMHLANSAERYVGTPALAHVLAGHARVLMRIGEGDQARRVLQNLRQLQTDSPTIGSALMALAELAYQEGNYVVSIGLFDVVASRWPEMLNANSTALIQAGELYMLFSRTDEAKSAYERFLKAKIRTVPDWLAQLRLIELKSYVEPEEGRKAFHKLALALGKVEGQDLSFLRLARLEPKAVDRRRIISNLGAAPTTPYVFEALTVQSIQQAMDDGNLDDAFRYAQTLWREMPDAFVLEKSPTLFDRVLILKLRQLVQNEDHLGVLRVFYANRPRFENHMTRGAVHLMVGQSLRSLGMLDEARIVLQKGVGGRTAEVEPQTTARLYKTLAAILWENKDVFRLGEILDYLDDRFPKRFDDYDYWMATAHRAWWADDREKARKVLVYALNGPVENEQRLKILERLTDLYVEMNEVYKAVKTLDAFVSLHDEMDLPRNSRERRDARWHAAELLIQQADWAQALVSILRFLEEYPDDPDRVEARFFSGRALSSLGDTEAAKRQWDLVSKEDPEGIFGKLAVLELKMLQWRSNKLGPALKRSKL